MAQLSGAPHIRCIAELGKVPHPPLEDERRPLPTQGEAIKRRGLGPDTDVSRETYLANTSTDSV